MTSTIEALLRQPAAQAVGWALLQFVWQGAAVAVLTALALAALRPSASDVRYVVSTIALAVMLTLPIVTGVQKYQALRASQPAANAFRLTAEATGSYKRDGAAASNGRFRANHPLKAEATNSISVVSAFSRKIADVRIESFLPILMLVWLAGVPVLSLRLLTGWLWVQRLRTRGVKPAEEIYRQMAARLARQLHIARAISLLESTLVEVPTVIGFLEPVVLLPASVLGGLSPQQLEAILAHELAHIRRHDYVVNLLQTLVETVLFYHPAVWWLSRRIRIERENCCDDLAVSLCGDPVAYATTLADLEALRSGPVPEHHIAMAATGGSLLQRVRRLLGAPSSHTGRGPAWLAGAVALGLIGGIALSADGLRVAQQASTRQDVVLPVQAVATAPAVAHPAAAASTRAALRPSVLPAIAEATTAIPAIGSLPSTLAAAAMPLAPVAWRSTLLPPPVATTPVVAMAAPQSVSISHSQNDSHGNWVWSNNGEKLEVTYAGTFEFTDDDTDVKQMSSGGSLKITDGNWIGRHSVEIRERGGQIEHRYFVNASERPYEPEGRLWLQQNLPRFVRNTGIGAEARVARYLKSGGPSAVMTEIGRVDSSYVKGVYFKQLFRQARLTPEQYRQAMAQAAVEMRGSDYELAQLLISIADVLPADEASRAAYFQAASGIRSNYEMRRVHSAMLRRGPVSPGVLAGILQSARSISSDYELSELLRQIVAQQPIDERDRAAFFGLVARMKSDYERHRVLGAAIAAPGADATLMKAALDASKFSSDYEAATFLLEVLKRAAAEGPLRDPFFQVVRSLSSGYEKSRVLQTVARRSDASTDTLRALLQATHGMSGYDLSQVLQTVANNHVVTGELRDAFLDAADRLTGYEQGQVLTALVKSERRK